LDHRAGAVVIGRASRRRRTWQAKARSSALAGDGRIDAIQLSRSSTVGRSRAESLWSTSLPLAAHVVFPADHRPSLPSGVSSTGSVEPSPCPQSHVPERSAQACDACPGAGFRVKTTRCNTACPLRRSTPTTRNARLSLATLPNALRFRARHLDGAGKIPAEQSSLARANAQIVRTAFPLDSRRQCSGKQPAWRRSCRICR